MKFRAEYHQRRALARLTRLPLKNMTAPIAGIVDKNPVQHPTRSIWSFVFDRLYKPSKLCRGLVAFCELDQEKRIERHAQRQRRER